MLVVLDPGHDRLTGGKRSPDGTLLEYEFNQVICDMAEQILVKHGITVIVTKRMDQDCKTLGSGNEDNDLYRRVRVANNAGANIFVSVHGNAHINDWTSARGWEVYNYPGSTSGHALAELSLKYSYPKIATLGIPNRGIKEANFCVIRETHMPAILIEYGFYTNYEECQLMKTNNFRVECAKGLAQTVLAFFGISSNVDNATPVPYSTSNGTVSGDIYTIVKGDTLWGISQKYNMTVDTLKSMNDLTSDIIIADFFDKEDFKDHTDQERINNQNLTLRHEIFHAYLNESGLQGASLTFNGPWARNEEMIDWLAIQMPKIIKTFEEVGCL